MWKTWTIFKETTRRDLSWGRNSSFIVPTSWSEEGGGEEEEEQEEEQEEQESIWNDIFSEGSDQLNVHVWVSL